MIATAAIFGLAALLTWGPLRRALPWESGLAAIGVGVIFIVLLQFGAAG